VARYRARLTAFVFGAEQSPAKGRASGACPAFENLSAPKIPHGAVNPARAKTQL